LARNEKRSQTVKGRSKEDFSRLACIKKCPVCSGELEEGYMLAPRGMYWDTRRHKLSILGAEALKSSWAWTMPQGPALRCIGCGIAILDYARIRETPKSFLKKCVKCSKEIPLASEECQYCGTKQPEYEEP